jgi:2-polyprenyl-3-methyl-5-hydroxy-6-metoxy-1,4-benzoquinol methylase
MTFLKLRNLAQLLYKGLKQRAEEPEYMDDVTAGGLELHRALRQLRLLNKLFGAAGPTLHGVRRLWTAADKPRSLSILDVGSGSGDVNRLLLRWADKNRISIRIMLADRTEEACEEARRLFHGDSRVQVMRCELSDLQQASADIVTGTQFVHHFHKAEVSAVVERMLQISRLGIVINDIHRHWIPWMAVWLATHVISNNRYIRHDGPLSVAKGFRSSDWEALGTALDISGKFYNWRPLFRYVVTIRTDQTRIKHRG